MDTHELISLGEVYRRLADLDLSYESERGIVRFRIEGKRHELFPAKMEAKR